MAIRLSDRQRRRIREHARRDFPHECCGAMLGHFQDGAKVVTRIVELPNTHEDGHERRFRISAEDMFRLEKDSRAAGLRILGFYHSHPNHPAVPSAYDREWAWPGYSYVIVSVRSGRAVRTTSWVLADETSPFEPERIISGKQEIENGSQGSDSQRAPAVRGERR